MVTALCQEVRDTDLNLPGSMRANSGFSHFLGKCPNHSAIGGWSMGQLATATSTLFHPVPVIHGLLSHVWTHQWLLYLLEDSSPSQGPATAEDLWVFWPATLLWLLHAEWARVHRCVAAQAGYSLLCMLSLCTHACISTQRGEKPMQKCQKHTCVLRRLSLGVQRESKICLGGHRNRP